MKDLSGKELVLIFGVFGTFVLGILYLVALWTDRSLDFWLTYAKGTETDCPFWLSFVVTIFLNAIIVGANIITEIARLAL